MYAVIVSGGKQHRVKIRYKKIDPETGEVVRAWVKCMSDDVAKQQGYI